MQLWSVGFNKSADQSDWLKLTFLRKTSQISQAVNSETLLTLLALLDKKWSLSEKCQTAGSTQRKKTQIVEIVSITFIKQGDMKISALSIKN